LRSVWGETADEFKPERFLEEDKRKMNVGMVANVMTFGAGPQGCIGWKFA
jgi:cytochrome P450